MLNTVLVIALGGGLASQSIYPDQIDILRGADGTPQIELVLDTSGSMGDESWRPTSDSWYYYSYGCYPSTCSHYWSTHAAPTNTDSGNGYQQGVPTERDCVTTDQLSKNDQLKAALTGCESANDGVLDKWDTRVLFAIRHFGDTGDALLEEFDPTFSNHAALEAAVEGLLDQGGTPLAQGYVGAGVHMNSFWDANNTEVCRQNYIVLMTDGEGNAACRGGFCNAAPTANWVSELNGISISDAQNCFPGGCGDFSPPFADAMAAYMYDGTHPDVSGAGGYTPVAGNPIDALTGVPNTTAGGQATTQPIRTYTIGFQAPFNGVQLLQATANEGDGGYYDATTYQQLDQAFSDIISSIVSRSNVTFTAGSVQTDGIFSGNYIYSSAFRPVDQGHWFGTVRKYCILPANNTDDTCIFYYPGGNPANGLNTNPLAEDMWSALAGAPVRVQNATEGGSGFRLLNDTFAGAAAGDPPVANPLAQRRILTWRHGATGYIPVDGSLTQADTNTNNLCEHYSLLNKLHGFTYAVEDCAAANYAPANFDLWPQGDTINGGTVVLKYTQNCEGATDRCFVATVANDGMLHLFNAYSGIETSAIIPATAWLPNSIQNNTLSEIMNQPNLLQARKYYFDGRVRLFHDDNGGGSPGRAGNTVIDPGEPAHLIAPLGRGGAAYISIPVFNTGNGISLDGVPDDTRNPPRPLYPDVDTGYANLQDTWSAPWIGRFRYGSQDRAVAVFASGHRRQEDAPNAQLGAIQPGSGRAGAPLDSTSNPQSHACNTAASNPNWSGVTTNVCDPFGAAGLPQSNCVASDTAFCTPFPGPSMCCYDWSGWASLAPAPWNFSTTGGSGHSLIYGPIGWSDGASGQTGISYRVGFDRFQLQPGDYIAILDSTQQEAGRITGDGTDQTASGIIYSPWVTDTTFYLQFRSNGVDDSSSFMPPFNIAEFQYVRRQFAPPANVVSAPTVYVVDVNTWNGPNLDGSGGQGFSTPPVAGDARQAEALLARITSTCTGQVGSQETCVDQNTNANTQDLRHMVCGISSEISVYTEGDLLRSLYFIDRCGQIFKVDYNLRNASQPWSARRLISLNNTPPGAGPPVGNSKDFRQGFAPLELVLSNCNGRRSIGVYFGTGNAQRPAEFDNLLSSAITTHTNGETTFTAVATPPTTVNLNTNPGCGSFNVTCSGTSCDACCDGICTTYNSCAGNVCTVTNAGGQQWADIVGVVWDSSALPNDATLAHLENATNLVQLPTTLNTNGFFIELQQNEKLLRKPLVLEQVLYAKTYQPTRPATECISAEGLERFYVMNSCNARALIDGTDLGNTIDDPSDRVVKTTQSDIGGDFLLLAPKGQDPKVTIPDLTQDQSAELPKNPISRSLRMFMWKKFE